MENQGRNRGRVLLTDPPITNPYRKIAKLGFQWVLERMREDRSVRFPQRRGYSM